MTNQPQPQSIARNEPFQLQNILVPTDFSPESLKALRYGIAFARQFSAILSLAHIAERPPATAGFEAVPIALDDPEYLRKAGQELARFAAEHLPADIQSRTVARYGAPFEEVVSIAKERDTDLIVASTHGRTGFKRVVFGSTAERIVQRAPCPVLIVREREHEFVAEGRADSITRLKRILVPIDFSESSSKALRYALAFAKQFDAQIHCLHTVEIPYGTGEGAIVIESDAFQKKLHEKSKAQMTAFLRDHGAAASQECAIRSGTAYREIVDASEDRDIDLIIMGTHGRSAVGRFLLGSTTERVVRHAHCPVLVVREREHDFIPSAGS